MKRTYWANAAGFTDAQLEILSDEEKDKFDILCFCRYGPDQVTYGPQQEEEFKAFEKRIAANANS